MIIKSIKQIVFIITGLPIYLFSRIIPKNKKLAVIGSSLGEYFADNSKYYYISYYRTLNSRKNKNLIWISKNRDVVKELNSIGLPAEYLYSLKGIYYTLRASKAYISHQLGDINGPLMGGARIIQLWHGMPLRKIGYGGDWSDNNFNGRLKSFISKWLPYTYYMKCDILYAPCQKAKDNYNEPFSKSFRNGKVTENIILARQARTLCLDNSYELKQEFFPERELIYSLNSQYEKIISWLPTQRKQFNKTILDIIEDSQLDLKKLNEYCRSKNFLFVIKAHFLDFEKVSDITENLDFIFVYPYADPYPLLKYTDILITDYSSVFFDFLLVDRPIIFMCYDLKMYSNEVEFYYDFPKLQIGSICDSWEKVLNTISKIQNDGDDFSDKRNEVFISFNFVLENNLETLNI
tara:strand:+ start:8225 stop:9442 length:1218 start_codon:yes stop_codon:yes gene_type:complete